MKYFGNEQLEATRFKRIQEKIREVAMKVQTSLSLLNTGQQFIFCAAAWHLPGASPGPKLRMVVARGPQMRMVVTAMRR